MYKKEQFRQSPGGIKLNLGENLIRTAHLIVIQKIFITDININCLQND